MANTAKSEPRKISVTSEISNGIRRSGLSDPYFSIDSRNGMRGNGSVCFQLVNSSNTPARTGSTA